MSVFDILKETPKNNCGECGFPTCMAFAAAVHTGTASRAACPYIDPGQEEERDVRPADDPDTALVQELRRKVSGLDLAERAKALGGKMASEGGGDRLKLRYLGRDIFISAEGVYSEEGRELDPRDQILLYNYLFFGGGKGLSGRWTGLESFPNSISKVVTLKRYTEDKIASAFEGRAGELKRQLEAIGGRRIDECHADLCYEVPVLPMVPIQVHFWDRDEDDGFPAKVKVLFDENALSILDIESLIFAAERMAETLTGQE